MIKIAGGIVGLIDYMVRKETNHEMRKKKRNDITMMRKSHFSFL